MDEQREESGITFGEIRRIIFNKKWIALAVALAITLAGTLTLYFTRGKSQTTYSTTFTVNLSGNAADTYPDGTKFSYTDLISLNTLIEVRNSNEKFESIWVNELSNSEGAISISADEFKNYTITVKASYFSNKDIARDFLMSLASYAIDYYQTMEINYGAYLDRYETCDGEYETLVRYLQNQINYLSSYYSNIRSNYGDSFIVENGKTLLSYALEIDSVNEQLTRLLPEIRKNHAVKSLTATDGKSTSIDNYSYEYQKLLNEYTSAKNVYNSLRNAYSSGSSSIDAGLSVIKSQVELLENLNGQLTVYENYIVAQSTLDSEGYKDYTRTNGEFTITPVTGIKEDDSYGAQINDIYEKLCDYTEDLDSATKAIYAKVSSVSFTNASIIVTSGGMGIAKSLIYSLIVGIVLGCLVALIIGLPAYNKKKNAKKQNAEQAVTDENSDVANSDKPENSEQ